MTPQERIICKYNLQYFVNQLILFRLLLLEKILFFVRVDHPKLAGAKGRADDGLTPQQRNERDKKRLEEKAAKKAAQKTEQAKK